MSVDKYVSLDSYLPGGQCLHLIDPQRCRDICSEKKCAWVCPAGVFETTDDGLIFHPGRVCLECGACRLVCDNVVFNYPEAGRGVINHFG